MSFDNTMKGILAQEAEAQAKLDRIQAKKQALLALPEPQRLATELHSLQCHYNHIDQCGWDYEGWDDVRNNGTRYRYLEKASKVISELPSMTVDQIIQVITVIERG